MRNANQEPNRLREPNMLPFSASWRCYLRNLGREISTDQRAEP